MKSTAEETQLNAPAVPCGSEGLVARDSVGHALLDSGVGLQCRREFIPEVACEFCFLPLGGSSVCCSGCGEKFHTEALCMDVNERVISVQSL